MRHPDDFYETPPWCVEAIVPYLPRGRRGLDPACGDGAILDELKAHRVCDGLLGIEIDAGRATVARNGGHEVILDDALDNVAVWSQAELVVMNPPYKLAFDFVKRANQEEGMVTFALLRLGFLASRKRSYWLRENTPSVFVLPKRPSFTANGKTDHSDYAWMAWGLGEPRVVIL